MEGWRIKMHKHEPLVSVVIPVYKTPELYLRSCIESVLGQTIQNFEMILVDDGSPDTCGSICDEYAMSDNRIQVIHQKNAGVSRARNAGLDKVRGRYLTFLDADDLLDATAWEKAVDALVKYRADAVVFGWNDFTSDRKMPHRVTQEVQVLQAENAMCQIAADNFLCGGGYPWNKLWDVRRIQAVYGTFLKFHEQIYTYEDKLWVIRMLKGLDKVVLIPDMLYEYRFLPESLSQSKRTWKNRQFNAYDAYDLILDELQNYNQRAYRDAVRFYFAFCFADLKNLCLDRQGDRRRIRRTRRRLGKLSRRIRLGELPNIRYGLAWAFFLVFGW